jgi:hypothetical protein
MTTISALPDAPNPLTDSQSSYNSKALAFTQALPTLVTEINTVAGEVNTAKTGAETAETNAEAAQAAAEAAALQAQAAANVDEWVSGTSYTEGDCVWSPTDRQTYRRKVTGGGTTDPSADSTNWQIITSNGRPAWLLKTTTYTAAANEAIMVDTSGGAWTLTLPASPSANDVVHVADYAGTFATYNLTVARNSQKIMGLSEDMTVSDNNAAFTLTYIDATKGWTIL